MDRITALIVALLLGLLGGCAQQPPVPEDRFYRLAATQMTPDATTVAGTLAIRRFDSDGLHSGRAILYSDREQPLQLRQYHYHFWLDAPPRLIQQHMIAALRHADVTELVVEYAPPLAADYTVAGTIRRFEEVKDGGASRAAVELELQLISARRGTPLLVKDYHAEMTANSPQMHDVAAAFGHALSQIYSQFIADARSLL